MGALTIKPIPNSRGMLVRDFLLNHQTCYENWYKVRNQFPYFNVLDYGATGQGIVDDVTKCQNAVNAAYAAGGGTVFFPPGTFRFGSKLVCKTGVNILGSGWNSMITGTQIGNTTNDPLGNQNYPYLDCEGVSDVSISDLKIDGQGIWTATPFTNPYGGGNSVGFTNLDVGIRVKGACSNILVTRCYLTGLSDGCYCYGDAVSTNVQFLDNLCETLGIGNRFQKLDGFHIDRNVVNDVLGNMTAGGSTSTANSKFGDGIYIERCINGTANTNKINGVIRIGIVLEGDGVTLDRNITINGNSVENAIGNRGTEINAFYWIEGSKGENPISLSGNTGYNSDAVGIVAHDCVISGGSIRNCGTAGLAGGSFHVSGVQFMDCKYGADISNSADTETASIVGCRFEGNEYGGLSIEQGDGDYQILGNVFKNNGTTALTGTAQTGFGIRVNRYYNNQKVVIRGNTFVSSVNQADNHATISGQFYGILGVAGGDFSRTTDWISGNTFLYEGTLSAYPANLGAIPCAFAYDNTAGTVLLRDFCGFAGNIDSKMPQIDLESAHITGRGRFLGFANAAPTSGSYLCGDWFYNTLQDASHGQIWLCVADGSPGTWEERGWGNNIRTGGLKVTAGGIRSLASVIAQEGTGLIQAYGVGTVPDQALGNTTESVDLYHNGNSSGAVLRVTKTGSGTYRKLSIQINGSNALVLDTDQSATFGGRIGGKQALDVASANDITIGAGNFARVTGTTTVNRITITGWQAGSEITIQTTGSLTLAHQGAANTGTLGRLNLVGSANVSMTANDVIKLMFDGTEWWQSAPVVVI